MNGSISSSLAEKSVLVVDDEAFIRKLVERILGKMGVSRIRVASSGTGALDEIDANGPPDIILCDLNMPEMDGIEFLRHLVDRNFSGSVALISGEDKRILETVAQLGEAQNLNILGAISKPVTAPALTDLLLRAPPSSPALSRPSQIQITPEELEAALSQNLITAHYQPKVRADTGELEGVETLIRWTDPVKGPIPPPLFIAVAEDHGLIERVTTLIFKTAMAQGQVWRDLGLDLKIAVNVSADNLSQVNFPEFMHEITRGSGMNPHRVILEVTETRLMTNIVKSLENLTRLRLKGFELSIDDFGTGHSSLAQLKTVPFSELKVDRSFVHGATQDETAYSILDSALSLARRLGLHTVAEGVETQEDWELVTSLGVDLVQGYYVGRPLPGEQIPTWLEEWRDRAPPSPAS